MGIMLSGFAGVVEKPVQKCYSRKCECVRHVENWKLFCKFRFSRLQIFCHKFLRNFEENSKKVKKAIDFLKNVC